MIFGGGHDLAIGSDCNVKDAASSSLGYTYRSPFAYKSPQSRAFLGGAPRFRVSEIEVYKILFI